MATVTHAAPTLATTSIVPALLPVPFHFAATGVLIAALGGVDRFAMAIQEAGKIVYLVVLAAFIVSIVNTVLFVRATRGAHISPFVPLGLSVLPWILGLVGTYLGSQATLNAVQMVDPADKATIMAAGIAESLNNRMLGAWYAGAQLAAAGIALGALATGRVEDNHNKSAAPIAAAALLCAIAPFMVMRLMGMGSTLLVVLAAIAFGVALLTAALGATGTAEHHVSVVASAGFAGAGAIAAAGITGVTVATIPMFSAIANVNPADKMAILQAGMEEVGQGRLFYALSALIAFIAAGAVAVIAFRRSPPEHQTVATIAIPLAIAVGMFALDGALSFVLPGIDELLGGLMSDQPTEPS